MKFLKESFLKFNTYTQIQIGVIAVAFCIFFITVCLLSIISLMIINTTYTEIQAMLELKENDRINGVSILIDSQINIITEISKIYEFSTRAFIENNLSNKDFLNNFKSDKYKNYIMNFDSNDTSSKTQIYQRCLTNSQTPEYEDIKKIFAAYLEVIEYTNNNKFYKNDYDPMFKLLSFYSNENKCILYYPKIQFNEKYSIYNFMYFISFPMVTINNDLDRYIDNYNLNRKKENIAINLSNNPIISGYNTVGNLTEFYKKEIPDLINLIAVNFKFKENLVNSNVTANPWNYFNKDTNPYKPEDVKDYLVFEFSDTMVDKLVIRNLNRFPAFKTVIVNGKLLGKTSCGIMQNIYKFYNNSANKTNSLQTMQSDKDCFLFKKEGASKTIFEDYFYSKNTSSNYLNVNTDLSDNFRRFVKIPIAYDSNYPNNNQKAINYKILKFKAADVTTRILINSYFTVWLRPQIYILKSYSPLMNNFRVIYTRFLGTELLIISVNMVISFITGVIVVLLTFKVSKSIGDPINLLISIVKNINPQKDKKKNKKKNFNRNSVLENNKDLKGLTGLDNHSNLNFREKDNAQKDWDKREDGADDAQQENENGENNNNNENENENTEMKSESTVNNNEIASKEKNLNNIKFPDDETINNFFNICKKLIKGGISDENLKVKQMQYNDEAYNNISFMKSNNLIVQEEKILRETESRSDIIFSHKSLIEKIKVFNAEKANTAVGNNTNVQDYFSQASLSDNLGFNHSNNNANNFSMSLSKVYNPNSNANIIVSSKNGDEIKEIKLERQKTLEKPIKSLLTSNKQMNSFMIDSPQKSNIFIGGDYAKAKYETVDLYPKFKEKKAQVEKYFQNTKNVNMLNLSYENINFMMHSNIERKKTDNYENNLFNEENEFDKIVAKHFNRETLDKVFEFLKLFTK